MFSATRQPACDALADLSIEHYDGIQLPIHDTHAHAAYDAYGEHMLCVRAK